MDLPAFIAAFDQATAFCREFAQKLVTEELPTTLRFDIAPVHRTPDEEGLIRFLGGRLVTPAQLQGLEPLRARKYLWVDGKIPHWIDLSVHSTDHEFTFVHIRACDRVTADDRKLYYVKGGTKTPFHVVSPPALEGKFVLWPSAHRPLDYSARYLVSDWSRLGTTN